MRYIYRLFILLVTAGIMTIELVFQGPSRHSGVTGDIYEIMQNLSYIWLVTVPVALSIMLGWIFLLGDKKPNYQNCDKRLIIRYVTRGINVDALMTAMQCVFQVAESLGKSHLVQIEVVSDREIPVPEGVNLVVVPEDYRTPNGSLFKARALYYLQTQKTLEDQDWVIYLDEESRLTDSSYKGILEFMGTHGRDKQAPIGQGAIMYTDGGWFLRGADALRLGDDLGRYKLQYTLGIPMFGIHGSFLLIRGDADRQLPFDVGKSNSIAEDTAWALKAWQKGYRFSWVKGFILEQPTMDIKDFLKQRQRWLSGMKLVIKDPKISFKYKILLSVYTYLWQYSFVSLLLSGAYFLMGISNPGPVNVMTDFSFTVYLMTYLIGNAVTGYKTKKWGSIFLTALYPVYGLLETFAAVLAFKPINGFYVVKKASVQFNKLQLERKNRI